MNLTAFIDGRLTDDVQEASNKKLYNEEYYLLQQIGNMEDNMLPVLTSK